MIKLIHSIKEDKISKDVETAKFLLTNKKGGYLYLDTVPSSRFQGFFFNDNFQLFKTLDNIRIDKPVTQIVNNFSSVVRHRGKIKEEFVFPNEYNSFIYELKNHKGEIIIDLDCRSLFDDSESDRFYNILVDKDKIIINYEKRGDYKLYFVITGKKIKAQKIKEWNKINYPLDADYNIPIQANVFSAVRIMVENSTKLVFTAGTNLQETIKEGDYVYRNINKLKRKQTNSLLYKDHIKDKKKRIAFNAALNSLNGLIADINGHKGIISGFPFNPEFRIRDELGCVKALGKRAEGKIILERISNQVKKGWLLPNALTSTLTLPIEDGIGWLHLRHKKKNLLLETLKLWRANEDGLIINKPQSTWMYSVNRSVNSLELQMFKLHMLKSAGMKNEEKAFKQLVKKYFYDGKILKDGFEKNDVTPNIFMARYIYPDLLSDKEWIKVFRNGLNKLWNNWGSLSTIDKKSGFYHPINTGFDKRSKHSGDSHFFINNIAAITMKECNPEEFSNEIKAINDMLIEEILWNGVFGHVSELSSSKSYKPSGCLCHAWAAATFIELNS